MNRATLPSSQVHKRSVHDGERFLCVVLGCGKSFSSYFRLAAPTSPPRPLPAYRRAHEPTAEMWPRRSCPRKMSRETAHGTHERRAPKRRTAK